MPIFYFTRHGTTDWNQQGLIQGRTDRPLLASTVDQYRKMRLPETFSSASVYSSPLTRAVQTAQLLSSQPPLVDVRLIERSFGIHEGKKAESIFREPVAPHWGWETFDEAPPQGESLNQVKARLVSFLCETATYRKDSLVVTHKGVLFALVGWATNWVGGKKPPFRPKDGCYHAVQVTSQGDFESASWNLPLDSRPNGPTNS